jgi:sporulation protein YlmC with PRC-barrel domain
MADDPAGADDPALADDPAATDDPAMADDPAATDAPAMADDPAAADEGAVAGDEAPAEAPQAVVTEQQSGELRSDWIIGTSVMSPQDETIGSIQDLIIDEEEGRVTAAVLSVGGFLGFGAKNIAVDWNELQINHDAREITLDITREEADAAPEYAFRDQAEAPAPAGGGMGAPDAGAAPPPGADPGAPGGDPGAPDAPVD